MASILTILVYIHPMLPSLAIISITSDSGCSEKKQEREREEKIEHEKSNSCGLHRIFPIHATSYDFKARGKLNEKRLRMNLEKERLFRREMPWRELRLYYAIGFLKEEII